jgi:hypothetical protein
MTDRSDGKAAQKAGKGKKSNADPAAKAVRKIAEELGLDEIKPDRKIGKRVRYDPKGSPRNNRSV